MSKKEILQGTLHQVPESIENILLSHDKLLTMWNALTSLARNEWICWVSSVKKEETRVAHIKRLEKDILAGKKRPCCWPGCLHRKESDNNGSH